MSSTKPPERPRIFTFNFGALAGSDEPEIQLGKVGGGKGADTRPAIRTSEPTDLSHVAPSWFLIGAGGTGKTKLARWLGEQAIRQGSQPLLAALDPLNRTLADFFDSVIQPPFKDPAQTVRWLRELTGFLMGQDKPIPAVLDMGGGDTALLSLVRDNPKIADTLLEAGIGPVAAYVLGPRVDDLEALHELHSAGFRPKSTVLVLNEGRVDSSMTSGEGFARIIRHSSFRSAVDDGAAVVWMPAMTPLFLAQEVEAKRLHFADARDGIIPDGRKVETLGILNRALVRGWLERMDAAFEPLRVKGWLPW